jgi:hypothetical protein
MEANVNRRVSARVIVTIILAVALALIPPVLYRDLVYGEFFFEDAAKDIANQFLGATRWIHTGGIIAIWLLNLVFFIINQRKGDCGRKLKGRNTLQNALNILIIVLSVAATIGYRYAVSADVWRGVLFGTAVSTRAIVWMPYYIVALCGWFLWRFCRKAAPATNCPVTWPIAKWFDARMTRAQRTR